MAGPETFAVVSLAVALAYSVESAVMLVWPSKGATADKKRTERLEQLALGAVGVVAAGGFLLATGGLPLKLLAPTFAAIEVFKGAKAAGKVADARFGTLLKWVDLSPSSTTPKRKAVTVAALGLTGVLETFGLGLLAFIPAATVVLYAVVRRLQSA
jgi:hypothetical protein